MDTFWAFKYQNVSINKYLLIYKNKLLNAFKLVKAINVTS